MSVKFSQQFTELAAKIWQYAKSYLLWLISSGLGLLLFLNLQTAIKNLSIQLGADQWTLPAVHRFTLLILAVAWIAFIYICEAHYRKMAARGTGPLLRAFALVTGWELGLLVLSLILAFVFPLG